MEGISAGAGKGYSKKESQQEAAHETLQKIKNDPQFIDAIFAAKSVREQASAVDAEADSAKATVNNVIPETATLTEVSLQEEVLPKRFDDTESIIAAAEEKAFLNEDQEEA